jgi:hypothetical protein
MEKEKVLTPRYLAYEFLGTTLLTLSYNMTKSYETVVLVASIWAWNHSAAHFNMALTVGEMILLTTTFEKFKNLIGPFFLLIFM